MSVTEPLEILVVDDDAGHTALVRRNLKRSGIENHIETLHNGSLALDYVFRRGSFSARPSDRQLLVLLDINMPGIDGVEVLRQIKANAETRKIPVIILTTTDDPREINRCYQLGCNVYVTKPVDSQAFIDAVQRLGLFLGLLRVPRSS